MQFNIPSFEYGKIKIGVYRIWFNEKWMYIGSSKNLRSRFSCWKSKLQRKKLDKHLNIKQILGEVNTVRFEILKEYNHPSFLRKKETEFLNEYWDNPMLLNRCPDGSSNKNQRPYNGYIAPIKIKKETPEWMLPKKLALFKKCGEFIKIFNSRGEAIRELKLKHHIINKILRGERGQPRKYIVKEVNKDGSFIEPQIFVPKNPSFCVRYIPPSKPVCQYDMNGKFINKFNSVKDAAKFVGCSRTLIFRVAGNKKDTRGCKSISAKGYIWKYA